MATSSILLSAKEGKVQDGNDLGIPVLDGAV